VWAWEQAPGFNVNPDVQIESAKAPAPHGRFAQNIAGVQRQRPNTMIDIAMGMNFHSPHGLSFSHKLNDDRSNTNSISAPFLGFGASLGSAASGLTEALGNHGGRASNFAPCCRRFCSDRVSGFAPRRGRQKESEASPNPEASQKTCDLRAPRGFPSQRVSGTFHPVHSLVISTTGFVRERFGAVFY